MAQSGNAQENLRNLANPAQPTPGMDVVRVAVDQGGDRLSVLELEVPSCVPLSRLADEMLEVYKREGLPEWHEGSFCAALSACAQASVHGSRASTWGNFFHVDGEQRTHSNPWAEVHDNDDAGIIAAVLAERETDEGFSAGAQVDEGGEEELRDAYAIVIRMGLAEEAVLDFERGLREATREMVNCMMLITRNLPYLDH